MALPKRHVVDGKCLPCKPGNTFWTAIIMWLFMDRLHAPAWAQSAVITVFVLVFFLELLVWACEVEHEPELKD